MIADTLLEDADRRMQKSVTSFFHSVARLRTGRANPELLKNLKVDYYGNETPLNQVASISVQDATTLLVAPWDKGVVVEIEKVIREADLGLNPVTQGEAIRVPLPSLNEERRLELIKLLRAEAEQARVAIRNIRRDVKQAVKNAIKEKEMTEDEEHRCESRIQKTTDEYIAQVDKQLAVKEEEMMEI